MVKEKKILLSFSFYLFVGLLICFIGISNVFAATYYVDYSYSQKYFDNNGSIVTGVTTTWNESLESYVSDNITTSANSYGAGLSITSPIPILENHTYTLSFSFVERNNIALSKKNYIGISSTLQGAANNYANNDFENELITSSVSNNSILNFAFTSRRNGQYIFIPWTTLSSTSQSYVVTEIIMEDLGSEGVSINDINSSLTNQTTILNTSINNMGEEIKDSIKDEFNTCRASVNLIDPYNSFTTSASYTYNDHTYKITSNGSIYLVVPVQSGKTYTLSYKDSVNFASIRASDYNNGGSWLEYGRSTSANGKITFTSNSNTAIIQFVNGTTNKSTVSKVQLELGTIATTFEPYGEEICKNKIDETNDKLDETNNQLGDLNNNLTDSSPTDMSGLGDSAGWLPSGPVDSILTLPLTMLNSLVTNLSNNSCQTVSVELPFVKENITLPCIKSLYDKMGVTGTLFTTAGLIASAFILFNYLLSLYKWVDDTLTMRENTMPGYFDDNWGGGA